MLNSRFALGVIDKYCRIFYKAASKIIVLSPGFKRLLCQKGVPEKKIEVIYNWSISPSHGNTTIDTALAKKLGFTSKFNVIFAGNFGKVQGLSSVLDAAAIVQSKMSKIQFVFVGGGVNEEFLKNKARSMKLNNVLFLPRCPVSEIGSIMSLADVLLVHLKDIPLFRITIPSKTQAYLSIGRPILMGIKGDATELVLRAKAGIACEPENPESIAKAVKQLAQMSKEKLKTMGENGRRFYNNHLSLEAGVRRFDAAFKSAGGSHNLT
jgi:glycosyltransferase involved in cell wall biosynthesis